MDLEKQRVIQIGNMLSDLNIEDSKEKKRKEPNNRQPWFLCLIIVCCMVLEYNANVWLPKTLKNSEIVEDSFVIENAKSHLKSLTDLGPRLAGTHVTEVVTPVMLIKMLKQIKKAAPDNVLIEIDQQHPSSHFYIDFLGGINNVYSNVTNVVAKLSWIDVAILGNPYAQSFEDANKVGESLVHDDGSSILINAHFDSVPGSPGVACMIEAMRALSQGPALKRSIVFLFNGAEESNHQAAHGFITQHKWAPSVKYLINLEAIGAGGREMVFQCNSGWLAGMYARQSPYPHTQVIAHELFKNFLYRVASTDWSTLIKYGTPGMVGIDTAYIENGYVYHTSFDSIDKIPDGTYRNTGENLLHLTKALATAAVLNNNNGKEKNADNSAQSSVEKHRDENAVFFDILGLWVIVYSGLWVTFFHVSATLFGLYTVYKLSFYIQPMTGKDVFYLLLDELVCFWFPAIVTACVGVIYYIFAPMRWYGGGSVISCLIYGPVALSSIIFIRAYVTTRSHKNHILRQIACISMFCLIAVPFVALEVMSCYIFCEWIVFTSLASLIQLQLTLRNNNKNLSTRSSSYNAFNSSGKMKHKVGASSTDSFCEVLSETVGAAPMSTTPRGSASAVSGFNNKNGKKDEADATCVDFLCDDGNEKYLYSPAFWYQITMIPMIVVWVQSIHLTLSMLIPLLGKSGTTTPSDILLGALFGLLLALPSGCVLNNEIHKPLNKRTMQLMVFVSVIPFYFFSTHHTPYSNERPKRLWVQHIERISQNSFAGFGPVEKQALTNVDHTGTKSDHGLWISAFDSTGMSPLKELRLTLLDNPVAVTPAAATTVNGVSPSQAAAESFNKDTKCSALNGNCYLNFPWYFPVADALQDSVYVETAKKPQIPDSLRLKFTAKSTPLTAKFCEQVQCDENIRSLFSPPKLKPKSKITTSSDGYRVLNITVSGPDHMHLVLRDGAQGKRIPFWKIVTGASSNQLYKTSHKHNYENLLDTQAASPVRAEGLHYFQIGFGMCTSRVSNPNNPTLSEPCTMTLLVVVQGTESIQIASYGHYVAEDSDPEITGFIRSLPQWSKGAEWTNFPSMLIRDIV